jgi:glycolate oxidase iron-sulfur subunit
MKPEEIVDYALSLDCVHCGLCLRTCPTYMATGRESASPRGRIHLMRAVAEGQGEVDALWIDELDHCLLCRNCESVCPSGVEYAHLLAHTREALADDPRRSWLSRRLLGFGLGTVLTRRGWLSLAATALELAQRTGLFRVFGRWLGPVGRSMRDVPPVPPAEERRPLPTHSPAHGPRRDAVAVLEGCVMPELLGRVNRATVRVLQACGRDVHAPAGHVCCGALHAHNGDLEGARRLARGTIAAFEGLRAPDGRPATVVVNSAGCSAQMKEYGELLAGDPAWAGRARAFSARVRDVNEYLADEALDDLRGALGDGSPRVRGPIAYDDPCHLCHGQGVRSQPRILLDALGVERVELEESESCCGSAGLYSTLRPDDSREILAPRLDALERCGARTLVTANPGCHLQWAGGVASRDWDHEVLHVVELVDRALNGDA